jgi:hypothetical protein
MTRQSPTISSRRNLFDYLEEQMNRSYRQVLDSGRLETDSTYIKTFLVEFDWPADVHADDEVTYLTNALTVTPSKRDENPLIPSVSETHEEGFYIVVWHRQSRNPLYVYLDTISDPLRRFWLAYSLSDARDLDTVLDRLSTSQSAFDRVWLWPDVLEKTQKQGEFRGIGFDYDYRRFQLEEGEVDSTDYFKLQMWGGPDTEKILRFMREEFTRKAVLSKVRMKYWDVPEERERFALEDIKYNGKFTTRGTSFSAHQSLVSSLRVSYSEKIHEIESNHTIRTQPDTNSGIQGDPIFFNLSQAPIENLDTFCNVVFSGHLPFRLWGVPRLTPHGEEGRLISAVDLHTGSKLFFEVYPDTISMYLYPGSCGNTVARFFTNLQHTFSRLVIGENNEGAHVL